MKTYNPSPGDKVICEDEKHGAYFATVKRVYMTGISIEPEMYASRLVIESIADDLVEAKPEMLKPAPINATEVQRAANKIANKAIETLEELNKRSNTPLSTRDRLNIGNSIVHALINSSADLKTLV